MLLAESLVELMDGDRDDSVSFPDFLQVGAALGMLWSRCGRVVPRLWLPWCLVHWRGMRRRHLLPCSTSPPQLQPA